MCDPAIGAIEKVCGATYIKGLKRNVFVTGVDEVTTIPAATADSLDVDTAITLRSSPAGAWRKWQISTVKGTWKAEPQGEIDNPTFKVTVEIVIYGITAGRSYIINETLGHQFIALVTDNHDNTRIVGEVGRGAEIKMGEEITDSNLYKGTIEWETGHLPYFYNATLPT